MSANLAASDAADALDEVRQSALEKAEEVLQQQQRRQQLAMVTGGQYGQMTSLPMA